MSNWQNFEKEIAKRLKGLRHKRKDYGVEDLDVETNSFIIECKFRKTAPKYIMQWIEQARKYIKSGDKRIPLLAWKGKGTRYDDALVVLRLDDFEKLLSESPDINQGVDFIEFKKKILEAVTSAIESVR